MEVDSEAAQVLVVVAVIFHSDVAQLATCLQSIDKNDLENPKVVVCDTSSDGAGRAVARDFGMVWLDGSRNGGYAWASHMVAGTEARDAHILIITNSDVQFQPHALDSMVRQLTSTGGACYPVQYLRSGAPAPYTLLPAFSLRAVIARWLGFGRNALQEMCAGTIQQAINTSVPVAIGKGLCGSGAVMALTLEAWSQTGGLDCDFFLFEEDRMLGHALSSAGLPVHLCGDAGVVHEGGFRTRGMGYEGLVEALTSEHIAWRKLHSKGHRMLKCIQVSGLILRALVVGIPGCEESRARLRAALYVLRMCVEGAPRASDGFRVSATQMPTRRGPS